ncbi:hypothetical protein F5Y04DRAFT_251380 [Hypomontagnella monticulosa]|nr:hypothetical protein F5Y04DRAFT_251380 [Hypomontagnella monticulosa]
MGSDSLTKEKKTRKRRIRLSCVQCRKMKLSCDRNLPCQRCIRTGRSARCSFDAVAEQSQSDLSIVQPEQQIRDLQSEVAKLKTLLSKACLTHHGDGNPGTSLSIDAGPSQPTLPDREGLHENSDCSKRDTETSRGIDNVEPSPPLPLTSYLDPDLAKAGSSNTGPLDPRGRSPPGYYSRHTLFKFFDEIPELFPFIRDTADEWFKPLGVYITKDKSARKSSDDRVPPYEGVVLNDLLPPKSDTDALVSSYLDGLEHLHRVVHVPTFRREYASFWVPERPRHPAMAALILAMISLSTCTATRSAEATSIPTRYRTMCVRWISACEEWAKQQSPKYRRLVHYQIYCLIYLAKRVTMTGKKRWWKDTSSLIQDAIMDGLHRDSPSAISTPYGRELKRRIWAVLRELDIQNSFEYGLPSLLHNIDSDITSPTNLDDDEFSEISTEVPRPKPSIEYTSTSYQVHSSRSWLLRLEISRRLFSPGLSRPLSYEEVLRYTHEITQEIESIPRWDTKDVTDRPGPELPVLVRAVLLFQLKECILALHRPYLHNKDGRYWLSETVCYQTARDILLLNRKLEELGCQSLTTIRDDLLLASLHLIRITILHPKESTSIIMTESLSMTDLLLHCLSFIEHRHLRCCYGELWCFITMCAAIMLLKIHLGEESHSTAKASCAKKFLDLHYRQTSFGGPMNQMTATNEPSSAVLGWLDTNYPEIAFDTLDFDAMDGIWDMWEPL